MIGRLKKYPRVWLIIALIILASVCILIASRLVNSMNYHHTDNDFFTFWLAGHLVTIGQSPYDSTQWILGYQQFGMEVIPNNAFLYPLPLAFFFAPLGWLSFQTAYITWVTILQFMILISLALLFNVVSRAHSKFLFIFILAGVILFRPVILTLTQGQVSGLFLIVLAGTISIWNKGKWFWGGFLVGLTILKPNLGLIITGLLAVWLIIRKHWSGLIGIIASGLLIMVSGLIYQPNWVTEYWSVGSNKLAQTFGGSPTVWGLSALVCHGHNSCILPFGGIAALLLVAGLFLVIIRHKDLEPVKVVALTVAVTLLTTPYTWTYDQLLLIIPIALIVLALDKTGRRLAIAAAFFPAIDVLVVILLIFDVMLQVEILNVFIPLIVFILAAWYLPRTPNHERRSEFPG
jgi:hypothetical protein